MLHSVITESYVEVTAEDDFKERAATLKKADLLPEHFAASGSKCHSEMMEALAEHIQPFQVPVCFAEIEDVDAFTIALNEMLLAMGIFQDTTNLSATFDLDSGEASLCFEFNGRTHRDQWPLDEPWVADRLLEALNDAAFGCGAKVLVAIGDDVYALDSDAAKAVSEACSAKSVLQDPEVWLMGRILASAVVSITCMVLMFVVGGFLYGWLESLMLSAATWFAVFIVAVLAHLRGAKVDKAMQVAVRENPVEFGMAIADAFVNEAIKMEGNSEMGKRLQKMQELKAAGKL